MVCFLADSIFQMLNKCLECDAYYPCWLFIVKVLAVKLDFDFRVSLHCLMQPLAQDLAGPIPKVTAAVLGYTYLTAVVFTTSRYQPACQVWDLHTLLTDL